MRGGGGLEGAVGQGGGRVGGGIIMLGDAQAARGWRSPRDLPGVNQTIYVYVADLDAHHARAVAGGAMVMLVSYEHVGGGRSKVEALVEFRTSVGSGMGMA